MKNIISFLIITTLLSCTNDDTPNQNELEGIWNLINVSCECNPVDFSIGEHVWNFDVSKKEITVVNNPDEALQILDNGSYSFSIDTNTITILNVEYDFYFKDDKLFLGDQPELDGPLLEFVRN